ncbi:hypothetical protein KFE25_002861 [Diacronema lutheri]|uniref:Uncharacterized protein n=1 Tax=Diacronema lutheri TaxID=2081491 RepID=A0A8J5XLS2_DIALT|nr:hypothetical protein KFE25_002861 [Diacronema lutheri]
MLSLLLLAGGQVDGADFQAWKVAHGKAYGSAADESVHFAAWSANRALVSRLASLSGSGELPEADAVRMALNGFADVAPETFARERCGLRPPTAARRKTAHRVVYRPPPAGAPAPAEPAELDWRELGLVTKPKDQGSCGSCWAFSAVAAIEGQHARQTGVLVTLSEMNLVDCVHNETINPTPPAPAALAAAAGPPAEKCCDGCSGGLMDVAYEYLLDRQAGGIDTEDGYAYRPRESRACLFMPKAVGATIRGWVDVPVGDEGALLHAVATVGPVSVGVDARAWQLYFGGVFPGFLCSKSPAEMDHGVAVVGFGTSAHGTPYWIVKNSWGALWGERGYLRLHRGSNACGVANAATYTIM